MTEEKDANLMMPGRAYVPTGSKVEQHQQGGEGSGNFGHEGRPGEVGGSGPGGSTDVNTRGALDKAIETHGDNWYKKTGGDVVGTDRSSLKAPPNVGDVVAYKPLGTTAEPKLGVVSGIDKEALPMYGRIHPYRLDNGGTYALSDLHDPNHNDISQSARDHFAWERESIAKGEHLIRELSRGQESADYPAGRKIGKV